MAKFDVFVGRQEELSLIKEWAERHDTSHILLIGGVGGVGKTFLLQKVAQIYKEHAGFAIDYYDLAEHPPGTIREALHLVESLGSEHFPEFLKKIQELQSGTYDVADIRLPQLEHGALVTLMDELSVFLGKKRLIRLTDTLDAYGSEGNQSIAFYQYAHAVPNMLAISAGRNAEDFLQAFQEGFGEENVTYIQLAGFDRLESDAFFNAVDPEGIIKDEMRAKLHFLTGGRPVLLSLAVEWFYQNVPLPDIIDVSLKKLQTLPEDDLGKLLERFEFELVDRLRALKSPLDRAILYMAHLDERLDVELLSLLLGVSGVEAETLVGEIASFSFVRFNPATDHCTLHDEMKHLVNRYAWPYVDPEGEVRRKITLRAIEEYYKPKIAMLRKRRRENQSKMETPRGLVQRTGITDDEWQQWLMEAEALSYHLKLGEKEGWAYFEDLYEDAVQNNHIMRMHFLFSEMERAHDRDKVELRRATLLRRRGDFEAARQIAENVLAKGTPSSENELTAHVTLGEIAASTDPERARRHFRAALEIAEQMDSIEVIGHQHNNLGRVEQLVGNLKGAVEHYERAIEMLKKAGARIQVASTTNNLAYAYRLQGDLIKADIMCRTALAQRQRLGSERHLAYSYLTKGEIDRDMGDLESSEHYTKLALQIFDKLDDWSGQIMAYESLANVHRHLELFAEAESYIERGIALAEQIGGEHFLASLYNVYGREKRDHARSLMARGHAPLSTEVAALLEEAKTYLQRSLALAGNYGDHLLIARSKLEIALVHFIGHMCPDEEILALLDQITADGEEIADDLLRGYIEEIKGEIAFRNRSYSKAARRFGEAARIIMQHSGREPDRFFDRLSDNLLSVELSIEEAQNMAGYILEVTKTASPGANIEKLRMLCGQILEM